VTGDGGRSTVVLGSIIVASVLLLVVLAVLALMVVLDPVPAA
jgi:hypothetical protein